MLGSERALLLRFLTAANFAVGLLPASLTASRTRPGPRLALLSEVSREVGPAWRRGWEAGACLLNIADYFEVRKDPTCSLNEGGLYTVGPRFMTQPGRVPGPTATLL